MNSLATNNTPETHKVFTAISQANLEDSTKQKYLSVVENFLSAGGALSDFEALIAYADTLPNSTRSFFKAALRLWSESIATEAKRGATPSNVAAVQATVFRVEALQSAIRVKTQKGRKVHFWLSRAEVKALLETCSISLIGFRNKIVLGLLVAAGLRRREAIELKWSDVKYRAINEKMRTVLEISGKGSKIRGIPINDSLASLLDLWASETNKQGFVLRSCTKQGVGDSLSESALFKIVRAAGHEIGYPDLAPHDLRRTFAQLGYEAGVPITQISVLLGHASIQTTQRYLNLELDLSSTVSDFIPF